MKNVNDACNNFINRVGCVLFCRLFYIYDEQCNLIRYTTLSNLEQ